MSAEMLAYAAHWAQVAFLCAVMVISFVLVIGISWYLYQDIRRVIKKNLGPR